MLKKLLKLCVAIASFGAGPLLADDAALILRNHQFDGLPNLSEPLSERTVYNFLLRDGFDTLQVENASSAEMTRGARRFRTMLSEDTDRVIVYMSGHMMTALRNSWFMGVQSGRPDLFSVPRNAISVNAILDVLANHPGRAVLILATHDSDLSLPEGLRNGVHHLSVPQGVTVIETPALTGPRVLSLLLSQRYTLRDMRAVLPDDVRFSGYTPENFSLSSGFASPAPMPSFEDLREDAFFDLARDLGTIEALQAYLDRYPSGRHSAQARELIFKLEDADRNYAENTERALNLSREDRRAIQANLTLLGFDTRGVDGVFGRGTRAAIAAWQRRQNLDPHGYLDGAQVSLLQRQADRRRDEIAEEEERERAEREAEERRIWREAKRVDTVAAYRNYLESFPDGRYRDKALERLEELGGGWVTEEEIARDRKHERQALGNPFVRILAEQRLASLGFRVGNIDGQFDDQTRSAIKAFQKRNDLPQTGYIGNETLNALLP